MSRRKELNPPKWLPARSGESSDRKSVILVKDSLWTKIASVTQLIVVILIGAGLVYSVYPTYQKDLLEEQVAKLTLEALELEVFAKEARSELRQVEGETEAARVELLKLQSRIQEQAQALSAAEAERRRAMEVLEDLESEHVRFSESAEDAAWRVYKMEFMRLAGKGFRDTILRSRFAMQPFADHEERLEIMLDAFHQVPLPVIWASIDQVSSTQLGHFIRDVADIGSMQERARSKIEPHQELFICQDLSREEWLQSYNYAINNPRKAISDCVEQSWRLRKKNEGWSERQYSRIQAELYESLCLRDYQRNVFQLFVDSLRDAQSHCNDRLQDLRRIMDGRSPRILQEPDATLFEPPNESVLAVPAAIFR